MKKILLPFLMLFCLQFAPAKAQWVTIPDPNFVTFLQQNYSSCMNGNQMNTTCSQIVNSTQLMLNSSNISDLTGIEYFVNLTYLSCAVNLLTSLPSLPNSLVNLDCSINQLTSLPTLPNSLTYLTCNNNQLTSLPSLPSSLVVLKCNYNQFSSLPSLPNSLHELWCSNNQLTSLPSLPSSLAYLTCSDNPLNSLPSLPNSLNQLNCCNSQLTSLPYLPNSLTHLWCFNNQLTHLPPFPAQMSFFRIENNNISCLYNLPYIPNGTSTLYANISNNPITCVPNQTIYSGALPLCFYNDSINNPNNCVGVNIIGKVFEDLNGNCVYNNNDILSENISVKLYNSQNVQVDQTYTLNGAYSFANLMPDTFSVSLDTLSLPLTMDCGQSSLQTLPLSSVNQTIQNINFAIECNAPYDVWIQSLTRSGWVFPGQIHTLRTNITNNSNWFNLNCDTILHSGNVSIQVNGPITYVAPAPNALPPTVNGNTFSYNITDFNSLTPQSFGLRFLTDTTAQAGDQICVHVEINPTPLDGDTTNNVYDFCYQVVNSYDPNMKEVYPVNVLPGYDDWFTYTIHFQNTGNAPAFNIRLRDTLDANLDINSFEVRGYSHPAQISINGNILTVRFNNIMLPDSTTDYEGSMGYFQYRLKPLPNLPNGTQIENTAYIYFDYNAPIITNTTQNNFDLTVRTKDIIKEDEHYVLYPNPSAGIFMFKDNKSIKTVEVFNMIGELILSQGNAKIINLQAYPKGIYVARVNGTQVCRLVKE